MDRTGNNKPKGLPPKAGTYYCKFLWMSPRTFIDHDGRTVAGNSRATTYVRFSEDGLSIPGQPELNVNLYADQLEWYYNEGQATCDGKVNMDEYREYLRIRKKLMHL